MPGGFTVRRENGIMAKGLGINRRINGGGSFGGRFAVTYTTRAGFARPYSGSALLAGEKTQACPTCKVPGRLSQRDVLRGYQCDSCAAFDEGVGF